MHVKEKLLNIISINLHASTENRENGYKYYLFIHFLFSKNYTDRYKCKSIEIKSARSKK